jgi:pyruvate/2-oxoglutarate/acetoin dehydrogenase E1 component
MIVDTMKAAEQLARENVSCEVIDVASLAPVDFETILDSVVKTGRLVIVHEAVRTCGVGAEIAATVAEQALYDLRAPVQRVCGTTRSCRCTDWSMNSFRASNASPLPCARCWSTDPQSPELP